jgi:hypothetical protein
MAMFFTTDLYFSDTTFANMKVEMLEQNNAQTAIASIFRGRTEREENYWFEYLSDYNIMFIRMSRMHEREDISSHTFFTTILNRARNIPDSTKIIFDLRNNEGGVPLYGLDWFMNSMEWDRVSRESISEIYVIINRGTYSGGIVTAAQLRNFFDNVTLIGQPTSCPPNFFAGAAPDWTTPNSRLTFRISANLNVSWPEYEYDVLMPDILIEPTIEDFLAGRDVVMEYIKSR